MSQFESISGFDRIRVVTPVFPHPRHPERGRFLANLTDAWRATARQIDVFSVETLGFRIKRALRPAQDVSQPGIKVTWAPTLGQPFGGVLPQRVRRRMRHYNHGRVVAAMTGAERGAFIYAKFISAGAMARKVSKITGEPYFVDLGESKTLLTGPKHILAERRAVMADATGVVCVSPRLRDEAIELGADPDKVQLMPNAPDPALFHPRDRAACRAELGLDPEAFLALYVGRFSDRKGVLRVDAALKQMRTPVQVAYLGSGELKPDFAGKVFQGSVGHDQLPLWMNAADVLVLPTLAEGCCNVIAEAMACGLPVVSSDIDDIRWQVPAEGVVLVDPRDPAAIAAALDDLASDSDRLAGMRRALADRAALTDGDGRSMQVLKWIATTLDRSPSEKVCA